MNVAVILFVLIPLSIVLGFIKYGSLKESVVYEDEKQKVKLKDAWWQLKFVEFWNDFLNFFVTFLMSYYFIAIRLPILDDGRSLTASDFLLFLLIIMGAFGHLSVLSYNVTKGIQAILDKVLLRQNN